MTKAAKRTIFSTLAVLTFWVNLPVQAETITVQCVENLRFVSYNVCKTPGRFSFTSDSENTPYMVNVRAPRSHCSDVTYEFYKPGSDVSLGGSGRLRPGQGQLVEIGRGFVAGTQELEIVAIGHVGGCNEGTIDSWAATVDVVPVP